ncbi:acetyltransferase [Chryseobacterium binzhouense]|uniref:acetyltransferase n=1 Tax=Chryseobacterium binzhouense TaxID=2593646 RepID=UPI00289AF9A9|nr:acetyltransferase [Chryseobacterium binzhouense]
MYLYGASGHGKVIAEIAEENNVVIDAFIDQNVLKTEFLEYKVLHGIPDMNADFIISIGNNFTRKKIADSNSTLNYMKLFHPRSIISKRCVIDVGTVVMGGVTINPESKIGRHCIINTNSSIDHDCIIEDFVHISPNAALAGDVKVGEGTHIGIGANIIQGIRIGRWCTIGAGAVIIKDVPDGATVVGNPGKIIKIKHTHN